MAKRVTKTVKTPSARTRARGGTRATSPSASDSVQERQRGTFLRLVSEGASVTAAVRAAGIGRATPYRWKDEDRTFADAWKDAKDAGLDLLEDRALALAHDGNERLLIFLLESGRPEKYRRNYVHRHEGTFEVNLEEVRAGIQRKLARIATATGSTAVARKPKRG